MNVIDIKNTSIKLPNSPSLQLQLVVGVNKADVSKLPINGILDAKSVIDMISEGGAQAGEVFTSAEKTKLAGIAAGATNVVVVNSLSSSSSTSALSASKGKDLNDRVTDALSRNEFTSAEKTKLQGIAANATNTPVMNTLTSTSSTHALTALQGKILKDLIDALTARVAALEKAP